MIAFLKALPELIRFFFFLWETGERISFEVWRSREKEKAKQAADKATDQKDTRDVNKLFPK